MTSIKELLEALDKYHAIDKKARPWCERKKILSDKDEADKVMEAKLRKMSKLLPEIKAIIEDILDQDWPDSTMVDLLADIKKWEDE